MRADIQLKLDLKSVERLNKLKEIFKLDAPEQVISHALAFLEEAQSRATKDENGHQYITVSGIPSEEEVSAINVEKLDPEEFKKLNSLLAKLVDPIDLKPIRKPRE